MTWEIFTVPGAAGSPRGDGDSPAIQLPDELIPLDPPERDVEDVRKPLHRVGVDADVLHGVQDRLLQPVPQGIQAVQVDGHVAEGDFTGLPETHDGRDVLRPRPALPLLATAELDGMEGRSVADIEDPDSLGRVDLVAGDGEKVHGQILDVEGDLPDGLDGVGMHENAPLPGHCADRGDGRQRSGLVVAMHDGDEKGPVRHGFCHLVRVDETLPVHGNVRHPKAPALEKAAGVQDGGMLDGGGVSGVR